MACEHKRLKSVNCVIMCADCGAVLPAQYAAGGGTTSPGAGAPPSPEGEGMEPKKRRGRKKKGEGETNG